MSWRDNYRTASFRGATFHVDSSESSHGRRQAVHEHAQRDVPYTEDLGRKAREFTVSGYLLGANYQIERDALIAACEQDGSGLLVHPYRGEITVVCRGLNVSERSEDGGKCDVSITLLEAGSQSFPRAVTDNVNAIGKASNSVTSAASGSFISRFLTTGFPSFVRDAAAARLSQVSSFLSAPGFSMSTDINSAASFAYSVRELAADAADLVLSPSRLIDRLTGLMGSIRNTYGSNSFAVLSNMFAQFDDSYEGKTQTPSRKQQGQNYDALGEVVRQVALAEAAKAAVVTEYPSYQEAITARTTLLDAIDNESESTASDDSYVAMTALRAQIVSGIPQPDQDLPQLVQYVPASTLPALVVAHNLYGDASRADEITARNHPRHPGFLTGGQPLEVLSDG